MKHSRESRLQAVAKVDKLRASGMVTGEACRQVGLSESLYYWWRKQINKPEESREIKTLPTNGSGAELKQLRIENQRLRTIVSDLMLDKQALLEYAGRK